MKPVRLSFFPLVTVCFSLISGYADFTDIAARSEKAVFQVLSYDEFGSPFALGTGFFIDESGLAYTNIHLIEDARFVFIKDYQGSLFSIEEITRVNRACDLAEIKANLNGTTIESLTIASQIPQKASDIFVIGNPKGLQNTISTGIISSIREDPQQVIQITAPISPGSSGSPIMDMKGNVVAIATYQHREGQNLNFGYGISCLRDLEHNHEFSLSTSETHDLFIINKVNMNVRNLVLNSIEFTNVNTVANLSFTNTNLGWGDNSFIYATIGNPSSSYYLFNNELETRYFIYDSTVGRSLDEPTWVALGETKKYKLFFPPIEVPQSLSLIDGMNEGGMSFHNLELDRYREPNIGEDRFFNDFAYQASLRLLSSEDYEKAYEMIALHLESWPNNSNAQELASIVSFQLGNFHNAFVHIEKAQKEDPTNSGYYFNAYYMHDVAGNKKTALEKITLAIQFSSNQPEFYLYRGNLYFDAEFWSGAVADYSKYLESDRAQSSDVLLKRAISYFKENKFDLGCSDFEAVHAMQINEKNRGEIVKIHDKLCK